MESNNQSAQNVTDLITRLKTLYGIGTDEAERKKRASKYVIYVRKSTDRSERQERSIDDQIAVCRELATAAGLGVIPIIHEER